MFSELRTRVEMTFIHRMMITTGIMRTVIACIPVKTATVCSMVSKIMYRTSEIEETSVRVYLIHPQITNIIHRINRTEKVFDCKKTSVCRTGKNPAKVIVSFIQIPIISIKCSSIGTCHTRQIRIHSTQKVKVYFKQIIVLTLVQIQFESHTVCQKTSIYAYIA